MRVISLLPGATDTIVALGGRPLLVGVSHACDHPAAAGLPRITSATVDSAGTPAEIDAAVRQSAAGAQPQFALDREAIDQLAPDLLLVQGLCDVCAVRGDQAQAIAASLGNRPRVVALAGGTVDAVLDDIMTVGREIALAADAEELVLGLRRRMRAMHDRLKAARAPRPRVAVLEWTDPLFASGHWVPDQVRRAGGVDVLARPGAASRVVTMDDLREANPEVIVVAPCGFDAHRAEAEARRLRAAAPWLAGAALWAIDANALTSRPGPRVVDGIEVLAPIFAPALFRGAPDSLARRVA